LLRLNDVSVHYGRIAALQHLSLDVNEGEFVGLVGHNGAGKSTTLWTITGVLKPSSGEVTFKGNAIARMSPDAVLRLGISLVPENRRIFGRLTVGENLRVGTSGRRDRRQAEADIQAMCDRFPVLGQSRDRPGSKLSGGEQQQLAIARALLARPDLLLLDEPTLGLAPLIVDQVFEILQELHREGVTILLVEQNAARTIEVADRTYVMRSGGRIQFHGTAEDLQKIGDFEAAYIGMGQEVAG
jgi:branched-chain amino acid transport system ATP-binding protein